MKTPENPNRILIVGGGPSGMMLASCLSRYGVKSRIIDRAAKPDARSKAMALLPRTLEIFHDLGLAEEVEGQANFMRGIMAHPSPTQTFFLNFEAVDSPKACFLSFQQYKTESLLRKRVSECGLTIERPVEFIGWQKVGGEFIAELKHEDNRIEKYACDWIIGCDGGSSTVRNQAKIKTIVQEGGVRFVFADVFVEWELENNLSHPFYSKDGLLLAIPHPEVGFWRIVFDISKTDRVEDNTTLESFERRIKERSGLTAKLSRPQWIHSFAVNHMRALKFESNSVFIVGDAAHCHSPVGAQGMNTGLQDCFNLAWKLALVAQGISRPELLDSYNRERAPVAKFVLFFTNRLTKMVTMRGRFRTIMRRTGMRVMEPRHILQPWAAKTLSGLTFHYRNSPIVSEQPPSLGKAVQKLLVGDWRALHQWRVFRKGPRAGDRALSRAWMHLSLDDGSPAIEFVFRGTKHTLLIFTGMQSPPAFDGAALRQLVATYSEHLRCLLVCGPGDQQPTLDAPRLIDSDWRLHKYFNATGNLAFVVRPDHYVGHKCEATNTQSIRKYLDSIYHNL